MSKAPDPQSAILRQIRRSFFSYRRDHAGKSHIQSERLRQLVLTALSQGHSLRSVGKAAGLSSNTIYNWRGRAQSADSKKPLASSMSQPARAQTAVELKVVKKRQEARTPIPQSSHDAQVRIVFRSGAVMECATSALTPELVAALQGGGS